MAYKFSVRRGSVISVTTERDMTTARNQTMPRCQIWLSPQSKEMDQSTERDMTTARNQTMPRCQVWLSPQSKEMDQSTVPLCSKQHNYGCTIRLNNHTFFTPSLLILASYSTYITHRFVNIHDIAQIVPESFVTKVINLEIHLDSTLSK